MAPFDDLTDEQLKAYYVDLLKDMDNEPCYGADGDLNQLYWDAHDTIASVTAELRRRKMAIGISPEYTSSIIGDPLAWEEKRIEQTAPLNLYGAGRFWSTVQFWLGFEVFMNGTPEFSELVIPINDSVGLQLKTEYQNRHIDFHFVRLDKDVQSGEENGAGIKDE